MKIKVDIEPCDIAEVLGEVCARQQEIAENHAISCDLADIPEIVQADPGALEQVFTNLLSNAVKYAPDAPNIEVMVFSEENDVVVSVRDHGIGIDEDDLSGNSVSGIGDVNGDGRDDILIAAQGVEPGGNKRGQVYVVYGIGDPPTPADLIEDLIESVISLGLNPGAENSLLDKLFAALNVLENGNINATVVKLVEFNNVVNKKRGKQITDEDADQLISDAQEIIDLLEAA